MKTLILLFLFLLSSLSWAQTSLSDITELNYGFGNSPAGRFRRSEEIVTIAHKITAENGIQTKKVSLKNKKGESYTALQILPAGNHAINKEASRIDRLMSGIPLIFSPYDLSSGSNAFFDPNGTMIGVPYEFFEAGKTSSSYQHELLHAGTYVELVAGRTPLWAGLVRLLKGTYVTDVNQNNYFRFTANDEILATAFSVKMDAKTLQDMKRTLAPRDFNDHHGKAADILREIYFSAQSGVGLSKQIQSLANSAIKSLKTAIITQEALTLGKVKKNISVVEFKLNSFESNGCCTYTPHAEGTSFKLFFAQKPTLSQIQTKLRLMSQKALAAQKLFSEVEKAVPILIQYPQIDKVDADLIQRLSVKPYEALLPH